MIKFVNRTEEIAVLTTTKGNLIVIFGRRRVGKTTLVEKWGDKRKNNYVYSQAIEGSENVQIEQLTSDLRSILPQGVQPRTWPELLSLLKLVTTPQVVVLDEFPYLVQSNQSLPSLLQKWFDHDQPTHLKLILLGSSQSMMHGIFLQSDAPLYERADLVLKLEPMSYRHFCDARDKDPSAMENFLIFSMIGGVPRYWRHIEGLKDPIEVAYRMFFDRSARLEDEPDRLLKDEGIVGQQAKAIFESLGRGAAKPSEIASRMGIQQTALSKPLNILMHSNLVRRTIPFGESPRNSKRTLYHIDDYALRFWYQVYSPHRSRWHLYDKSTKEKLIRDHAAKVLEDEYRKLYRDASPYWEARDLEFDCVRFAPKNLKKVIVTELKIGRLDRKEKLILTTEIERKFRSSKLASKFTLERVEILDGADVLNALVANAKD